MKAILLAAGIVASALLLFAVPPASAEEFDPFGDPCRDAPNSEVCLQSKNPADPVAGKDGVLVSVVRILSFVVGAASVIMVIYGGLKYVTSNGDANAISSAKNTVLYALVGVVVFAFSQAIVIFVLSRI